MKKTKVITMAAMLVICLVIFCTGQVVAQTDQCDSTFNSQTNILHISCLKLGGTYFWLDLSLVSSQSSTFSFELVDYGETTKCVNIAGPWSITNVVDATNCGEGTYTAYYTDCMAQTECAITVTREGGTLSGEINGNQLTLSGSYPEEGGTTSISINATISEDGKSLTGSSSWTWSDGFDSCSGTSQSTGHRI